MKTLDVVGAGGRRSVPSRMYLDRDVVDRPESLHLDREVERKIREKLQREEERWERGKR